MVSHIYMNNVLCPVAIHSFYRYGVNIADPLMTTPEAIPVTEQTPVIRGITITDITARNARAAAAFIYGLPEKSIEDLALRYVVIEIRRIPRSRAANRIWFASSSLWREKECFASMSVI